ncbi:YciI family protein [Bdellovibrio sp. HCB209]|uniref:YciI family protein n=1 Tax=Bdellovibrio sp. HCB209 TaxID=3394354 RepID=UPI0039B4EB78
MKFILLIYHGTSPLPGTDRWNALSQDEQKQIYKDYAELSKTAGLEPGYPLGLPNTAKTVQLRDGKTVVKDGSYLPEGLGGYSIFEAENMEAAIALASRIPAARLGGAIEVRAVEKYW